MIHTKPEIKICGVKCPNIAYDAAKLGANYIGMIFHKPSQRHIDLKTAKSIVESTKRGGATPVGVCVDQTAKEMVQLSRDLNITVVQLHGDLPREQHDQLPQHLVRIYVLNVDKYGVVINQSDSFIKDLDVNRDYILFDGPVGGSGEIIMTDRIQNSAGKFRYFVAGGLRHNNICNVIDNCNPDGVDVSTGVENSNGEKDIGLIKNFILQISVRGGQR